MLDRLKVSRVGCGCAWMDCRLTVGNCKCCICRLASMWGCLLKTKVLAFQYKVLRWVGEVPAWTVGSLTGYQRQVDFITGGARNMQ